MFGNGHVSELYLSEIVCFAHGLLLSRSLWFCRMSYDTWCIIIDTWVHEPSLAKRFWYEMFCRPKVLLFLFYSMLCRSLSTPVTLYVFSFRNKPSAEALFWQGNQIIAPSSLQLIYMSTQTQVMQHLSFLLYYSLLPFNSLKVHIRRIYS